MRSRVWLAALVAISTVTGAGVASAKLAIAEASITGPGLERKLKIEGPDTQGLWESRIDVATGRDNVRRGSVEELGLIRADLGPRFLVTYRFVPSRARGGDRIRQHLYPYAADGPVTFTPPGQEVAHIGMPIAAGWYQGPRAFLRYLMDRGLPEAKPVPAATAGAVSNTTDREAASRANPPTVPASPAASWLGAVVSVAAAVGLVALAVRHRARRGRVARATR